MTKIKMPAKIYVPKPLKMVMHGQINKELKLLNIAGGIFFPNFLFLPNSKYVQEEVQNPNDKLFAFAGLRLGLTGKKLSAVYKEA